MKRYQIGSARVLAGAVALQAVLLGCESSESPRFVSFQAAQVVQGDQVAPPQAAQSVAGATKRTDDWSEVMRRTRLPSSGCFRASFPSTTWEPVGCVEAPRFPAMPFHG